MFVYCLINILLYISFKSDLHGWDFPGGPLAKTPSSQYRGPGLIPGLGNRPHMPQLGVCMLQLKIPHAAKIVIPPTTTKTWRSQIKIKKIYVAE